MTFSSPDLPPATLSTITAGAPMFERTMTDTELEIVLSKASALSAFFREIGPKYDEANTFAYPSIKAFKDSGLGAVPVPKEFGGLGGDLLTTSKVVSEL